MSTVPQLFLQAVLADPDDDRPRLVLADWLGERDDPRGEFIRLQCLQPHLSPGPSQRQLSQRARALERRWGAVWKAPLSDYVLDASFRRGFVETVATTVTGFAEHRRRLFAHAPIRELVLHGRSDELRAFLACAEVAKLRKLALAGPFWLGYRGAAELAACDHFGPLRELSLVQTDLPVAGLECLLQAAGLEELEEVDLGGNPQLGNQGLQALLRTPRWPRLRRLGLAGCWVDDDGVRALAHWPRLRQFERLDLNDNQITLAAFDLLVSSPFWSPDTELVVGQRVSGRLRRLLGDRIRLRHAAARAS